MKRSMVTIALVVASASFATAPGAPAKEGDVEKNGGCSESSRWKVKLSEENSKIETEFEVDQNVVGDDWKVVMKKDGDVFFRGTRTTKGRSGSFEVRRVIGDGSGRETVTARARNVDTDEVCRGKATW